MQTQEVTINFTGGIVSPGNLKETLLLAKEARVAQVRFGLRQQLRLEMQSKNVRPFLTACAAVGIRAAKTEKASPNLVSSYPSADIFTTESWLREGVYKDIFDSFAFVPQLKINVCDSRQCFVPFFTGHLNWIAGASPHYWQLYIRFPKTGRVYHWKEQVYTNDVPLLSQRLEKEILNNKELFFANEHANGDELFRRIRTSLTYNAKPGDATPLIDFSLPYYEGFNRVNNQLWLGIYRRNESFPIDFLLDLCELCLQTRIGQLYTTPWKSIIIKNIEEGHRKRWDRVLGQYRINVRHAANELNWQVEDETEKGLQLKNHIIRHFDKEDVRTYGLCFAVQTRPTSSMFGSVVIRKQPTKNPHRLKALERYDLLYKEDFNPNGEKLVMFREGVEKEYIGTYLVSLCKHFYEDRAHASLPVPEVQAPPLEQAADTPVFHQCGYCQTVYVPALGEEAQDIAPGTSFDALPTQFYCPLCEAPKESFVKMEVAVLL